MATSTEQDKAPRTVKVPATTVAHFTRQMSIMLAAGVPLLRALETLTFQEEYPQFGLVVEHLSQEVSEGSPFSRAVALYPLIFSQVLVTMIQVGEQTGLLEQSLDLVANWLEREYSVRHKILAAFSYPVGILGVSACLSLVLFTTVLPTFATIFKEMHVQMPLLTRVVMGTTAVVCNPMAWVVSLGLGVVGWRLWEQIWRTPSQARLVYAGLLRIPVLGTLLLHGSLTRYCAAAEALLSSGIDLAKAIRLAGQASGNPLLAQDAKRMVRCLQEGDLVSMAMEGEVTLYSIMLLQMVQAGEEASKLPEMYAKAAMFHDLELSTAIDLLTSTLEPLMLLGVALLVGCIVLSIYLPMYSTLMNLS